MMQEQEKAEKEFFVAHEELKSKLDSHATKILYELDAEVTKEKQVHGFIVGKIPVTKISSTCPGVPGSGCGCWQFYKKSNLSLTCKCGKFMRKCGKCGNIICSFGLKQQSEGQKVKWVRM
jgi:hypothetical protein